MLVKSTPLHQQIHHYSDTYFNQLAVMYNIVRVVFTQCSDIPADADFMQQYEDIAKVCSEIWRCLWEVRPDGDSAFYDHYNHNYHCLVVLYNMKTAHGLSIPVGPSAGARRLLMIAPHPFVQKYLPEEKQLKARAQVLQTKETSLSTNARSTALTALKAEAVERPMFYIDNRKFTSSREMLHRLCTAWVRRQVERPS
jgi:hypothetical protein